MTDLADNGKGYVYVHVLSRRYAIHRLSFVVHHGQLAAGAEALHTCDNPGCWNPTHLFSGTQADNLADMDAKGRRGVWHPRGDRNPSKQPRVREVLSRIAQTRPRSAGRFI